MKPIKLRVDSVTFDLDGTPAERRALQKSLCTQHVGRIHELPVADEAVGSEAEDEAADALLERITENTSWCISELTYSRV